MYSSCKLAQVFYTNFGGVMSPILLCLNHALLRYHLDIGSPYPRHSHNALHTKNNTHAGPANKLTQAVSDLEPRIGALSTSPLG